jgi:hypothetical protein
MRKNALEPLTARGGGILIFHGACRMVRWVYKGDKQYQFKMSSPQPKRSQLMQNASQFQENDTIYVPFTEVEQFIDEKTIKYFNFSKKPSLKASRISHFSSSQISLCGSVSITQ